MRMLSIICLLMSVDFRLDFLEKLAGEDCHQITESSLDDGGDDMEVDQMDDGADHQVNGEQTKDDSENEVTDGLHCSVVFSRFQLFPFFNTKIALFSETTKFF